MTQQNTPQEIGIFDTIIEQRDGLDAELSDAIRQIVGHIRRTGGKGKLALTLVFSKLEFEGGIGVSHEPLKVTLPKAKPVESLLWADRNNALRTHDQQQNDLFDGKPEEVTLTKAPAAVSPLRPAG